MHGQQNIKILDKVPTFSGHFVMAVPFHIHFFYLISKELQFTPSVFLTPCAWHLGAKTCSNFLRHV